MKRAIMLVVFLTSLRKPPQTSMLDHTAFRASLSETLLNCGLPFRFESLMHSRFPAGKHFVSQPLFTRCQVLRNGYKTAPFSNNPLYVTRYYT